MADDLYRIAKLGMERPEGLTPAEIAKVCTALMTVLPSSSPSGVFLVLVEKRVVAEIPAVDRRDALHGWLEQNGFATLSDAAKFFKIRDDQIEVMDKP